jgi:crotonobetaine/carnitine-CoA ligase
MSGPIVHLGVGVPGSAVGCRTLIELMAAACVRAPDVPAMIFEDGVVVTRRGLLERAERFAAWLQQRVRPGEPVAIMVETRAEFMIAFFAVIAVRGTLVSINPAAREADAGYSLRDSGAVLAIVSSNTRALVETLRPGCPQLRELAVVDGTEPDGLAAYVADGRHFDFTAAECHPEDVATIYYTSGTTGMPKGCMIDHVYWTRVLDVALRLGPLDATDRTLCCMQFYYMDPALLLLCNLHTGGSMVVMRRFSVSRFWKVVNDHDVTDLVTIASMPVLLLKAPPSPLDRSHKVRKAVAVGIPANLHRAMVERWGFPWLDNYGATESGLMARVPIHMADEMIGSGSMGLPCPEVEIRVVDPDGSDVPVGEPGEALIRQHGMFRGYLNKPEATAEALVGGWYHSGDVVRRDERGFFYFVGRMKDMIRRSGESVAAAEIEEVLRTHPKILDTAVMPVPDELRGEEIKAFILPVAGETPQSIPPEEIVAHCAARLAPYKVPRYIEYRDTDFPRTPSMRVQKAELRRGRDDLIRGSWDREANAWI